MGSSHVRGLTCAKLWETAHVTRIHWHNNCICPFVERPLETAERSNNRTITRRRSVKWTFKSLHQLRNLDSSVRCAPCTSNDQWLFGPLQMTNTKSDDSCYAGTSPNRAWGLESLEASRSNCYRNNNNERGWLRGACRSGWKTAGTTVASYRRRGGKFSQLHTFGPSVSGMCYEWGDRIKGTIYGTPHQPTQRRLFLLLLLLSRRK